MDERKQSTNGIVTRMMSGTHNYNSVCSHIDPSRRVLETTTDLNQRRSRPSNRSTCASRRDLHSAFESFLLLTHGADSDPT